MRDWLEFELKEELGATRAPDDLWDRIEGASSRPAPPSWKAWPIAAVLTLTVASSMLWLLSRDYVPHAAAASPPPTDEIAMSCTDPPARPHIWTVSDRVVAHPVAHAVPRSGHSEAGCGSCHTAL